MVFGIAVAISSTVARKLSWALGHGCDAAHGLHGLGLGLAEGAPEGVVADPRDPPEILGDCFDRLFSVVTGDERGPREVTGSVERARGNDVEGEREAAEANGDDAGHEGGHQHLVLGRDVVGVGVGRKVLAPAAIHRVVAEPAEEQARAGRLGGKVQGKGDRVGVPERDAEQGEDLRQHTQGGRVFRVGELRVGVER
jgi:hypothetical protein